MLDNVYIVTVRQGLNPQTDYLKAAASQRFVHLSTARCRHLTLTIT